MTAFTTGKIIAAESTLSIMARHAALRAWAGVMIQRLRLSDLSALRHPRLDLMAFITTFFLVLRMTEPNAESLRVLGSAAVAA